MQLVYATHTHTFIAATISEGEQLGGVDGPAYRFVRVDGSDPLYLDILANDLLDDVVDPIEPPPPPPIVEGSTTTTVVRRKTTSKGE